MVPTSLPGGRPRGMVRVSPRMPREAMWSRFGVRAYSSGVFPPSSAIGSSAMPSPWRTTYFIAASVHPTSATDLGSGTLVQLQHGRQPAEVGGNGERGLGVRDRRVGVLEPVPGEREDEDVARPEAPARPEPQRAGERDRRGGLGEHTLGAGEEAIGGQDVVVA